MIRKRQVRFGGGPLEKCPALPSTGQLAGGLPYINSILYPWCKREGISFTRGRPYKKNDQAYAEQKNWSVPRRLIGYDRYSTRQAYELMQRLYEPVRYFVNFFQPVSKLIGKERVGAKVKKRYDQAQTPYQRLLATDALDDAQRRSLAELYASLNPVKLRADIDQALEDLWKLADRPRTAKLPLDQEPEHAVCG